MIALLVKGAHIRVDVHRQVGRVPVDDFEIRQLLLPGFAVAGENVRLAVEAKVDSVQQLGIATRGATLLAVFLFRDRDLDAIDREMIDAPNL